MSHDLAAAEVIPWEVEGLRLYEASLHLKLNLVLMYKSHRIVHGLKVNKGLIRESDGLVKQGFTRFTGIVY